MHPQLVLDNTSTLGQCPTTPGSGARVLGNDAVESLLGGVWCAGTVPYANQKWSKPAWFGHIF